LTGQRTGGIMKNWAIVGSLATLLATALLLSLTTTRTYVPCFKGRRKVLRQSLFARLQASTSGQNDRSQSRIARRIEACQQGQIEIESVAKTGLREHLLERVRCDANLPICLGVML
jgi:hypothetical protein